MQKYGRSHHRKRTAEEYEKEAEDAVKRFQKYPEHLEAARNNTDWIAFLEDNGVYPASIEAGADFFESVREKMLEEYGIDEYEPDETGTSYSDFDYLDAGITVERYTTKKGNIAFRYRDIETGKWVKGG